MQNKLLISSCTGLGNFIQKTPMIKSLHDYFPNAKIDLIVGGLDNAETVLKDSKFINDNIDCKNNKSIIKKIQFVLEIRKKNYQYIFLPFDDYISIFSKILLIILCKSIFVLHYHSLKSFKRYIRIIFFILCPNVILVPLMSARREIDLNYDLLQAIIDKPIKRNYETFIQIYHSDYILKKFNLNKFEYIIIQPSSSSRGPTPKNCSINKIIEICSAIKSNFPDKKILLIGSIIDYDNDIEKLLMKCDFLINSIGKTTLNNISNLMQSALVSIVHDSGALHIGGAVNANMIALYGPTDSSRTLPFNKNIRVIKSQNECTNLMFNFRMNEKQILKKFPNGYCMDSIKINQIIDEISSFNK